MSQSICIVGGGGSYHNMFLEFGYKVIEDFEQADLLCFTGGADVSPEIYGHQRHPYTQNSPMRDLEETAIFNKAKELGKGMIGICRGAQFLNVMSGGTMYQDVSKHTMSHWITDVQAGFSVLVSSTHHQMMKPSPEAFLVAYSTIRGEREWWEVGEFVKETSEQDIEVVWYEHTKCLCFQPHPELSSPEYEGMRQYFDDLLTIYLGE